MTRTPLSLRQMKFFAALYGALAIALIVALTMPAGVVVVASALGIVEW